MSQSKTNIGHSLFERLLNYARINGEDFNLVLVRYGIERILYRLSISEHSERFILKGAAMFLVWKGQNFRVTRDVDLLGFGSADSEHIKLLFEQLCQVCSVEIDGIQFLPETIKVSPIREELEYNGIRVTLIGILHKARIPVQIDIGFGDAVTPEPEWTEFPTLLNGPKPRLKAYPRYTMVAEKIETMIRFGMVNSRMKDFYDVWLLSKLFEFDGGILCKALNNTLKRRGTPFPDGQLIALSDEFRRDEQKQIQWKVFIKKAGDESVSEDLKSIVETISDFINPVLEALRNYEILKMKWNQKGYWEDKKPEIG